MKTKLTTLLILVCMMCSIDLLVFIEAEASEVKVQLVIPEDVDDNETIFEIEKDELISSSKDRNITRENKSLPMTGDIKSNSVFTGFGCILISLMVFLRKEY